MIADGLLALHVLRRGTPGAVPLVLLHGFPLDHRMWLDVTDLLAGDPTVLAPDLPGFGTSPSGPGVSATVEPSISTMADAVAATLRRAGVGRAVVGGLSMGGYVAMALADRHPELVAGLALLDTRSTADEEDARANRLAVAATVVTELSVEPVLGMRTALLGASNRVARLDLVERLDGWIRDQGPQGVAWALRAMAARPDRTAALSAYRGPALVVVGEQDEITPLAAAEHLIGALAAGELVVVPGAGHMTANESPEPVAAALTDLLMRVSEAEAARPGR